MENQANQIHIRLFESLSKLLNKKSIENISVNEIIEDSGVSRATFYRYFKDKYDLMCWYYDRIANEENLYTFLVESPWESTLPIYTSIYEKDKKLFKKIASYEGQNSFREYLYNYTVKFFRERALKRNINPNDKAVDVAIQCFAYGLSYITIKWLTGEITLSKEEFNACRSQCYPPIIKDIMK